MRKVLALLAALSLCTACAEVAVVPTQTTPDPSPPPSPVPSPTPEPKAITVCLSEEPDSLYIYGTDSVAAHHVWEAIYDGPIDHRRYSHQPVILSALPSQGDGTAAVETVSAQAGDRVLAASGNVLELAPGVIVADAGGQSIVFDGTPITMAHTVVTFTLRPDLRWADGEPLTADDSLYSFEVAADAATPTDKHRVERTADYRAVDGQTIVWQGVPGFIDPAYALNFWHPLPRHHWEDLSPTELLASALSTREPLGWGPFVIRQWMPGQRLILERNRFYFRAGEGLPRLDEVAFLFVDSPSERLEGLVNGRCDVVTHEAAEGVLDLVGEDAIPPTVRSLTTQDTAWELLAFGINPALTYDRADFFEDVRVRRGIARCIDRQALAEAVPVADGRVAHSTIPPEHPLYADEALAQWGHDPQAGQQLLAQAGWHDAGDGVLRARGIPGIVDGTPFEVTYHTSDHPFRVQAAELVQADLAACGIQTSLHVLPPEELLAPGPNGVLFGRQFDLAQFAWRGAGLPLCDLFLSSQLPREGNWGRPNVAGFINAEYDEACREALEALPDSGDYATNHSEAQRIFSEQLPVLLLFHHQRVTLARTSVTGLIPTPSQRSELWNLERFDVQP
ncbi:MAG: ABC transporter substrate-binding protein [Chloroflexota bacterium]